MQQANQVRLCVKLASGQPAGQRGKPVGWTISVWTAGGSLPDTTVRLRADPAAAGKPAFSFGCGSDDGTPSCDLGTVDADAVPRQLQAKVLVPANATTVASVRLTVTGSAANLVTAPSAAAAVRITAPAGATTSTQPAASPAPSGGAGAAEAAGPGSGAAPGQSSARKPAHHAQRAGQHGAGAAPGHHRGSARPPADSPAPADNLAGLPAVPAGSSTLPAVPGLPTAIPSLSPGGNASGLFPTLNPDPGKGTAGKTSTQTRPVANTAALPESAPIAGAQVAGLAALALAIAAAVTRLSVQRRTAPAKPADGKPAGGKPADGKPAADDVAGASSRATENTARGDEEPADPDASSAGA